MNTDLLQKLVSCETDVNGAMRRFCNDEALYTACLGAFLEDHTMEDLNAAIDARAWDDAFTAAHALKGLAGNMGFIPLFLSVSDLVIQIRAGKLDEIGASYKLVRRCYNDISTAIHIGGANL